MEKRMNKKLFVVGILSLSAISMALFFSFSLYHGSRAAPAATWTLSYDSPNNQIFSLAVYAGKLYATGHDSNQVNGSLYAFDGASWTNMYLDMMIGVTVDMPQALQVFNGRLYIGMRVDVDGTKYSRVYYYNGVSFTEDLSRYGSDGYSAILDFTVHNNTLYTANASGVGEVYQRISDNNWITVGGGPVDPASWVSALASYNGSLYAGTGGGGYHPKVYRWSGAAWELVVDFTVQFGVSQDTITTLKAVDGLLYASTDGGTPPGAIYVYDGNTWTVSRSIPACRSSRLEVVDHQVWAGTCGGTIYRLNGATWEDQGATGEISTTDLARYNNRIYAATSEEGRIYSAEADTILMSIAPPLNAAVGDLVYVPVSLSGVKTWHDVRGVQLGVRTNDAIALAPAGDQPPRLGSLFPSGSLTYTAAITVGWDFMLTAPLTPTPPISGTGVIVELPFYAQATGCVDLTFADHILVDSQAITITHQIEAGQICLVEPGGLVGSTYLQSRSAGHYTGTQVTLAGPAGTYTATTGAAGSFTIPLVVPGVYTATFTHPLFVNAIRQDITITGGTTTTVIEAGLWAGDMNQDGDVDEPDWYICAAASIPVDDPAFDINDDRATDILDCTILAGNLGRSGMPGTNPPRTGLEAADQGSNRATVTQTVGMVIPIPLGDQEVLLRVVNVTGRIYAAGVRIDLPAGVLVTGVELGDGFTNGFLKWHQEGDRLYIVAAPPEEDILARNTDMVTIHLAGGSGEPVVIEAQNPVGEPIFPVYLAIIRR